ncbi:hypothetical protein [Streptomyces sp. HF10]|uniref:hypothetical protein n=1 Tax=Streptomyces sp. HF10 TaxID=2692233 RepID=UPI0013179BD6|nr:hypothetical protein [Streptomyces sp. HF10]QHC32943.1 hypothetical protein GR129_33430 [Streptomyces sp. HF10]
MSMPSAPQSAHLDPWGAPPLPPPRTRPVGLIAAIVGGAFLLIAAIVAAVALSGKVFDRNFPRAESTLTVPHTVLDGRYELRRNDSATAGRAVARSWRFGLDAEAVHGVVASYRLKGADYYDVVVTGMYGRFRNTASLRTRLLTANGSATTTVKVVVPPRDLTSPASPAGVSCEYLTRSWSGGQTLTYPVCVWADGNTVARVAYMTASYIDLKDAAEQTLRVRSEMLRPIR